MAEVDSLEIKLKSNAKDIAADFNALKSSVNGTSQALTGIDGKSFNELAKAVGKFASGKSNTDKLDDSLKNIAQSLNRFAQSINQIDTSKFNEITNKLNQIAEIGTKKINEAAKSMQNLDKAASQNSGVKKAKMSYDEFMQSIKGLGSDRTFYGNLQQVNVEIERTRNKIEKINASLEKYNAEGRSVETKGWRSAQAQLEQYTNYLDNLIAKQRELQNTTGTKSFKFDESAIAKSKDNIYKLLLSDEEYAKMRESILTKSSSQPIEIPVSVNNENLEQSITESVERIRNIPPVNIESRVNPPKAQSVDTSRFADYTPTQLQSTQRYSAAYLELQKQIEKAEKELEKYLNTQERLYETGVKHGTQRYKNVEISIEQADRKLQLLYADMRRLQAEGGDVVNISQFERLSEQTSNTQNTIQLLAKALRGVGLGSAARSVQSISAEMGSLSTGLASTAEAAEGASAAMAGFQTAIPVIGLVLAAVTMLAKAWIWLAKKAISAIKTIVDGLKSFITKIKEVASSILSIGTSSYKAHTLIGKFVQKIAGLVKSRLIRRAITQAFTEIREGFKKLDAYSASIGSQFHPNVQMILADLHLLGRSIAAAFEPIVNAVAPILDFLIQKLVTVINYINQFFSALSGSQTWTRATLTAEDYTTAASGAAKAQKDLNKSIREWDKLNVITDPNKNNGGGGSGSGAPTGTGYVTEDVESPIKNLAEKFKKAWAEGADFTGLGEELGKKLKAELDSINWDGIIETASKLGKAIATTINGFTSVEGLGDSIGKTIAEAINVAIAGFSSFAENIDGKSIGKFLGDIVKSGIDGINWKDFITGMGNLGKQLAEAVNSFVDADSLSAISKGLADILRGAIEGAYKFITNVDFKNLGTKIADSITTFFKELNAVDEEGLTGFQKAGATLSDAAKGIMDMLTNALQKLDWDEVGKSTIDFISSIDWVGLFESASDLKKTIETGLFKVFLFALQQISNLPFNIALNIAFGIGDKIAEEFNKAKEWLAEKSINISFKIEEIVEKVKTKIEEIKNWLSTNALVVSATLKESIGDKINDLKKKWEKVKFKTKNLTAKVKGGAIDKIKKVKTAWSNLKAGTKNFSVNLKGKAVSLLEKVKNIWDSLTVKSKELSLTFKDTVTAKVKEMWNGIARIINGAIEKIEKLPGVKNIGRVPTFKDGGFVGKRYATGGFPEDGWFRASQGEYFGKFDNGQQYIASNRQIENGLMNTVRAGNADVAVLMSQTLEETRRQNALLQQILAKENNISYQDVFKATQKGAKEYKQRVGKPAFT